MKNQGEEMNDGHRGIAEHPVVELDQVACSKLKILKKVKHAK
jgi:hypothetical protein